MRPIAFLAMLLAAGPATAQPEPIVEVRLTSFEFAPAAIRLRAGRPVTLRLVNGTSGGHNFAARDFFAAATIAPNQNVAIRRGAIEVPSRSSVTIRLTPAPGAYRLRCTHAFHTAFGMKGRILVS